FHLDVLAQVSFDLAFFLDDVADPADLVLRQVLDLDALAYPCLAENAVAARPADPEDVGQRDLDPLVLGQVHAGDPCHGVSPSIPGAACASGSRRSPGPRRAS